MTIPTTATADVVHWFRFEETGGFLNDSVGTAILSASSVDQVTLPSVGRGAQFPRSFYGDTINKSAAAFGNQSTSLFAEATSVDGSFTIELLAHIEDLFDPAVQGDAILAGQWSAVPPGLPRSDLSWVFHVEMENADEPVLSLSLSDGTNLLEYLSGIAINEKTDYFLAASFDVESNIITYHVQDLTASAPLQTVKVEHNVFQLNPDPIFHIGNATDDDFGQVIGLIDEVRFSRGVVDVEDLLISPGDFNGDGILDTADVNRLAEGIRASDIRYDLDRDGTSDIGDLTRWVHELKQTWFGDSNLDGEFTSTDFVEVFQIGRYETAERAGWGEGDWDGDGVFLSSDFVTAFQDGGFEQGPRADEVAVPEPSSGILAWLIGIVMLFRRSLVTRLSWGSVLLNIE